MTSVDRVAVLGTGLIGTSIGMAAGRTGISVAGYDVDRQALDRAASRSGLDPAGSPEAATDGAQIVFVCTPVPTLASTAATVLRAAPHAIVTDVGSVKSAVIAEIVGLAPAGSLGRFIGGHPMGGTERSGPDGASPSVVDGIAWVLTPTEATEVGAVERVRDLIATFGAEPVLMDPARHDRLVAFVSHLPQVASTSLMGLAAAEEAGEPQLLLLAAGGFRDLTRLAASNPSLWSEILLANREAVAEAIDLYIERLATLRGLLGEGRGDEVEKAFAEAKAARLTLATKPQVRAGVAVLQIPIPDRPGALAELTAALGEAGVNIEDLQIVHSPEGGRGKVHLTVAATTAGRATAALERATFEPARLA